MSINVNGGNINHNNINAKTKDLPITRTIGFYKAMIKAYSNNIGKKTAAGNEITENMIKYMKKRMYFLMTKLHD